MIGAEHPDAVIQGLPVKSGGFLVPVEVTEFVGEEIPGLLATLASEDAEAADEALRQLWNYLHHQGSTIIPPRITAHKACSACVTRTNEKAARACTTCKGEGSVVREQRTYKVRIPASIRDGQEVRIRELGAPAGMVVRQGTCP
ncbi:hypothetical protein [Streptomyces yanii]|uniref:Uncharacterized protein n=1 Tax=Streptomyces yanii TaxID=78510 RepID=A0ABV5R8V2_9ACTN